MLKGEAVADWPDDVYIQYSGEGISLYSIRAVRSRRYKYVYYPYDRDELYDAEADPWEMHNLAQEPEAAPILAAMKARMVRWMESIGDVMVEWNAGLTAQRRRSR
jgi:arylsulfatase A-like enzyme